MATDSSDHGVALAGREAWLRPELIEMLAGRGCHVIDKGRGTASLRGSRTLVILPPVVPNWRRGSGIDVGTIGVTLSAAVHDGVQKAVLLSRIGAGKQPGCDYLDTLQRLETMVLARIPNSTIVRIAHPIGPPDDPGPVVLGLRRLENVGVEAWNRVVVDALYSREAVAAIADAVTQDYGRGVLEAGGPARMTVVDLVRLVAGTGAQPRLAGGSLRPRWGGRLLRSLLSGPSTVAKNDGDTRGTDVRDLWVRGDPPIADHREKRPTLGSIGVVASARSIR